MAGAAIGAVGSIAGAMISSDSSSDAADSQSAAILRSQQTSIEEANKAKIEALKLYDPALSDFAAAIRKGIDGLETGKTEVFDILQRTNQDANRILAQTGANVSNAILGLPISPLEYYSNNFMQGKQAPYDDVAYKIDDNERSPGTWNDQEIWEASGGEGLVNGEREGWLSGDAIPTTDEEKEKISFIRKWFIDNLGRGVKTEGLEYWADADLPGGYAGLATAMENAAVQNGELAPRGDNDRWAPGGAEEQLKQDRSTYTDAAYPPLEEGEALTPRNSKEATILNWFQNTLGRAPEQAGLAYWADSGLEGDALIKSLTDGAINSGELPESARIAAPPAVETAATGDELAPIPDAIKETSFMAPPDSYRLPAGVTRDAFQTALNSFKGLKVNSQTGRAYTPEDIWGIAAKAASNTAQMQWLSAHNTTGRAYAEQNSVKMFEGWQPQTYGGSGGNSAPAPTPQTALDTSSIIKPLF